MKKTLLLLFLVFSFTISAQEVERSIIIKDADTNNPIEDVSVFITKTKQLLLSNSEGKVTFDLNGISNIQVSHSSYVTVNIRSSALLKTDNIIYLKNNTKDLDEIIVTKQHPQKILKALVQNSIKQLTVPARLKVYSREFFKMNGTYSYYNDGLMNFQIFGRDKNFKSNILVEQNRSIGLINEEISGDVLGYNLNNIMENYYNFKYLEPILVERAKKDYEFVIKVYSANNNYNLISATPLDEGKGLKDDFTIIYDPKKKLIIEVSSIIAPSSLTRSKEKTAVGSKNIYKSIFKTIYRTDTQNYYLASSKEEIGFERVDKNNITTDIEVRNYFVTTNFSNQNYIYKESEVFKEKTLYNKKNVILSDYWNVSGLAATAEEKEIIDKIE
ncbi:peptidase associated/transthyretin-like domain-containing protein [Flavobacterium solisilvae]|uniref:Carboxypeptidase-like regulatory domain-containing protein n=1 Tax=Flavobacterium solisilvae TaxID=1852019 RepID=A0ABX1QUC9_9FLAO|nr:hypothetical protein [Flavobacterium solisilvae]NMH24399.1 carboxypeptidase-like regulatory domain-containing protein [Flavobacterium solisilvae]